MDAQKGGLDRSKNSKVFSVILLIGGVFADMCGWTTTNTLFVNKYDTTEKVILREFGCGATDSGDPAYKVCKIQRISQYFIKVTEIDTSKLEKNVWERLRVTE